MLGLAGFDPVLDRHGIHGAENWQEKLGALIRDADTVVFVLSPASAKSDTCGWEVREAVNLGKRIIPVVHRSLSDVSAPPQLAALNYIFFYPEPKKPGSGFRSGVTELINALNTDLGWLRERTRLLQRALEWDAGGRQSNRLYFFTAPQGCLAADRSALGFHTRQRRDRGCALKYGAKAVRRSPSHRTSARKRRTWLRRCRQRLQSN